MPTEYEYGPLWPRSEDGRTTNAAWLLLALCLGPMAALCAGCGRGSGPERVVVSGEVTYRGKPVPQGRIRFTPLAGCPLPASGAPIIDGRYRADGHGGVPVGTHAVQIEAYESAAPKPGAAPPPMNPALAKIGRRQYLPAKYNSQTKLEFKIDPGSRAVVRNFDLTD